MRPILAAVHNVTAERVNITEVRAGSVVVVYSVELGVVLEVDESFSAARVQELSSEQLVDAAARPVRCTTATLHHSHLAPQPPSTTATLLPLTLALTLRVV